MENEPFEDVFPIENGDFPLPEGSIGGPSVLGVQNFEPVFQYLSRASRKTWEIINTDLMLVHFLDSFASRVEDLKFNIGPHNFLTRSKWCGRNSVYPLSWDEEKRKGGS